MTINEIVPLSTGRWETARERTEQVIRRRIVEPKRSQFRATENKYPPQLVFVVTSLMGVVGIAAFYISSLKEISVSDVVLHNNTATLSLLTLAEFGALLFGLGTRMTERNKTALRIFQYICVAIALIANITVTVSSPASSALVFDWLLTLAAPFLVLGIGLILEDMLSGWVLNRQEALNKFKAAYDAYQVTIANPTRHPEYNAVWGQEILQALIETDEHNREIIPLLIDNQPELRIAIVANEWRRHQWVFDPSRIQNSAPNKQQNAKNVLIAHVSEQAPNTEQTPNKQDAVLAYLQANPDAVSTMSVRTIAAACGVGVSTTHAAIQQYKSMIGGSQ